MEIKRVKSYYSKIIFAAFLAVFVFGYICWAFVSSDTLWKKAIAYGLLPICVLFLGIAINSIQQMLRTKPALTLSKQGLEDNVTMADAGLIPWSKIKKVEVQQSNGKPHLFVIVEDASPYIDKHSWLKKGMLRQLHKDHGSPIAIDFRMVDIREKDLMMQLQRRVRM